MEEHIPLLDELRVIMGRAHPLSREDKLDVISEVRRAPGMEPFIIQFCKKRFKTDQVWDLTNDQLSILFEYCRACSIMIQEQGGMHG